MKKSVDILGLSIISIGEGKELGTAKDLVIDAAKGEVSAIVVEDGKWYLGAKILPFNMIQGIGEYALTIETDSVVTPLSSEGEIISLLEKDIRVKGTKVLTKGGKMHGQVVEILIDEQSGKITGCEVKLVNGDTAVIPAEQVITFGKDVLIIRAENGGVAENSDSSVPTVSEPGVQTLPSQIVAEPHLVSKVVLESATNPEPAGEILGKKDVNKKFDEKQQKFVLGKKSTRRIEADNGELVVDKGEEITNMVIQKAKHNGKFIELTMSIAP